MIQRHQPSKDNNYKLFLVPGAVSINRRFIYLSIYLFSVEMVILKDVL